MAKSFVFLEITDPEIAALVHGIRTAADGTSPSSAPHVTIRGPYSRSVTASELRRYERILSTTPVVLQGFGVFEMSDKVVVYIKIQHEKLRQIWWKPDFPIAKYGFNPHVTLYEGSDRERAERLLAFLQREGIKLLTWNFAVTPHVSDHKDLFKKPKDRETLFLGLVNRGTVRPDILARLEKTLNRSKEAA
jgi:2'-5' RNA ligase